jgi:hypothetical protein
MQSDALSLKRIKGFNGFKVLGNDDGKYKNIIIDEDRKI